MKILLVAVNAKYIHSNPAVYSIASYAESRRKTGNRNNSNEEYTGQYEIEIAEYTINQPIQKIMTDIYGKKPDLLLFSCYIWNIRQIEELASDIGKVMPDIDIWLGGPEVSFDAVNILEMLKNVRGVICGEGEETFYRLAQIYGDKYVELGKEDYRKADFLDKYLHEIDGIVFRGRGNDGKIYVNAMRESVELNSVPFFYDDEDDFKNRIIYYESSRGCPFRCSYCLSSVEKSLRFRKMDLVKNELMYFLDRKVPQVKFIDRTFNCNHYHAGEIWRFLKKNDNGITNFHFEIAADILTADELKLLGSLRPGQIQLEIGVQSTNERTLSEINRPMDFAALKHVVSVIKSYNNIHIHLDLIAGLPFEDIVSFIHSFNDVIALSPHQLQLGFLKVLKGSPVAEKCTEYGLKYTMFPPYEVMETEWLSYGDIIRLKAVEEMVEVYYNSGQFRNSLDLLRQYFESDFHMYESLANWYKSSEPEILNFSRNSRYEKLLAFGESVIPRKNKDALKKALTYDYYLRENVKSRPDFLGEDKVEKSFSKEFYSRESREHQYLYGDRLDTDDPRLLRKLTHIEKLGDAYWLFDYTRRDPMDNNALVTKIAL